jgi:adenylate cyclase
MERRLAAILAADVVGYSRLMGEDEAGTLAALTAHRRLIFDPEVARHNGRIVKLMGDGALVEFASVVDAVECSLAVQAATAETDDKRITLRIGVNLGDVIIDGDDIYGEGVNVAARLEALAEPGGICISGLVHESLGNRIDAEFADSGEQEVKNIARPIRVWRWPANAGDGRFTLAGTTAAPDKPAIAILPFATISDDPELEHFSDGLTRDLISELGRFSPISVIGSATMFAYKGRPVSAAEVGREVKADYVLEGSVRKSGRRTRVTAHLTDPATGKQVWANRFDGDMEDELELQDERIERIAGNFFQPLMKHAIGRARNKPASGAQIYDHYLRSYHHIEHPTAAGMDEAHQACLKVLEADPGFALVYEHLGWIGIHRALNGWVEDPVATLRDAQRDTLRGIALDAKDGYLRSALGLIQVLLGQTEQGLRDSREASRLNPNDAEFTTFLGAGLAIAGRVDEALQVFDQAERLSPGYPPIRLFKAEALYSAGRTDEARQCCEELLAILPEYNWSLAGLAACQVELGDLPAARASVARLRQQSRTMTLAYLGRLLEPRDPLVVERLLASLQRAGLPA